MKVLFVMPLKAREVSSDWHRTVALTLRSLGSVFNQADTEFRAVLVCNEFPYVSTSPQLEIIEESFPLPQTWEDGPKDKYRKIQRGLVAIREEAPCYIMKLDADDLIHRDLVGHVRSVGAPLYLVEKGYAYAEGHRIVHQLDAFHLYCGSSNIVACEAKDLPATMAEDPMDHDILSCGHHEVKEQYEARGMVAAAIPFRAAFYSSGNQENHSGNDFSSIKSRRKWLAMLLRRRWLGSSLRRAFAFQPLAEVEALVRAGQVPAGLPLRAKA